MTGSTGSERSDHYDKDKQEADIAALSLDEARRQAELLLADPQKFECVVSPVPGETFNFLAPSLRSLFSHFESISLVENEAFLTRKEIELLNWDGNGLSWGLPLWKIGAAHGHSLALVQSHEEWVYEEVDGELGVRHTSIYHWLLWVYILDSIFDE